MFLCCYYLLEFLGLKRSNYKTDAIIVIFLYEGVVTKQTVVLLCPDMRLNIFLDLSMVHNMIVSGPSFIYKFCKEQKQNSLGKMR